MALVWIFAESRGQSLELLKAGLDLAAEMGGARVAVLASDQQLAEVCLDHGADEVLLLPPLAPDQPLEAWVPVLVEAALIEDPDIFFVGASQRGKEMAARLAAGLNTGLCGGCTGFRFNPETRRLVMERMIFGGAAVQTVECHGRPQMATIAPRTFEQAATVAGHSGAIRQLPAAPACPVTVLERIPKTSGTVDISAAKVVVCVGRGMEKKEDIALARELAAVLDGEVGCSRPVAEDLGWLPEEVYLGISGKKVKPDLYIGLGVAGQIQHISGIRESKVILGINRDENAPIFEAADYGIVGDLYEVVPRLISELKNALKK